MSKVVITNSKEFENIIGELDASFRRIVGIFNDEKKNTGIIDNTEVWTGPVQREMYNNLRNLEKNYGPIEEASNVYVGFMNKALDEYKRLEDTNIRNAEENSNNLDVNS